MKFLFMLLLAAPMAHAQWVTVAAANQTVTTIAPNTTWVRYGSMADNKWFIKAYSSPKTFVVGPKEYTTNPDPTADASTFILQVYQQPAAQTITVAGAPVSILAFTGGSSTPQLSGTFVLSATCTVNVTTSAVTCK